MRLVLIFLLSILVAACWTGQSLYADADSTTVLRQGMYRINASGEEAHTVRISILPGGLTQFEADEDKGAYGFAPLDNENRAYVAWFRPGDGSRESEQTFSLVERHPDGSVTFYQPSCDGEEAELARSAGATVEIGMAGTCRFPSRNSLESAMRQLRPNDYGASMKLVRIDEE